MSAHPSLIHIGYPKTGSSWLQVVLKNDGIPGLKLLNVWHELREHIVRPHPLWYDPHAARNSIEPELQKTITAGAVPVLSQELFAGIADNGGITGTLVADRLKELFSNAKILITIREQRQFIRSIYGEYVRNGGNRSLYQFLNPASQDRYPAFDLRYFEFHRLIKWYHQLFSKEQILVLPQELARKNPVEFCNRICDFTGVPQISEVDRSTVRGGLGGLTILLLRQYNRFLRNDETLVKACPAATFTIDRMIPNSINKSISTKMRKAIDAFVGDSLAHSNEITSQLTKLDLEKYNYYLP